MSPVSALCSPPDVWSHSGAGAVSPALVRPQPSPAQPSPALPHTRRQFACWPAGWSAEPAAGARPARRPPGPAPPCRGHGTATASKLEKICTACWWAGPMVGGRGGGLHRSPAQGELSIGQCRQPMVESFLKNVKPKPRPREQCGRPSPAPPPLCADCAPVLCKLWLASSACVQCRAVWGTLSRHHEKICFATVFIPSNNPSQSHPEYFATCQIFN